MEEHVDNPLHCINLEDPRTDARLGYHRRFTAEVPGYDDGRGLITGTLAFAFRGDRTNRRFYALANLDAVELKEITLPQVESEAAEVARQTVSDDEQARTFVGDVIKHAIHETGTTI